MIQSGTVSGNEAGANGGGVYAVAPNAFLRGGTVAGNTARQGGGGFYGSVAYVMGSSDEPGITRLRTAAGCLWWTSP